MLAPSLFYLRPGRYSPSGAGWISTFWLLALAVQPFCCNGWIFAFSSRVGFLPAELLILPHINLRGVSVLVPQENDLANAQDWADFEAQAVICLGEDCPPPGSIPGWVSLLSNGWLRVETDGRSMSLSEGK